MTHFNRIVAVGDGDINHIAYSDNSGVSWSGLGLTFGGGGNSFAYDIAYNSVQDKYITVGKGNKWAHTSNDGINWTTMGQNKLNEGRGIATNGNRWVVVGKGANNKNRSILYSDDGSNWISITNSRIGMFNNFGTAVSVYGNNWVAIGKGSQHNIAYSTDNAETWTHSLMVDGSNTSVLCDGKAMDVATNGDRWIVVANSETPLVYSDNSGQTWNIVNDSVIDSFKGTSEIRGCHWDGNKFWVGGTGLYRLAYSSNGINWIAASNPLAINATSFITYDNVIILGGDNAGQYTLAISIDNGNSWNGLIHETEVFTGTGIIINGLARKYKYTPPPVPYFTTGVSMPKKIGVAEPGLSFSLGRKAFLKKINETHRPENSGKNIDYTSVQGLQSSNVFGKPINNNGAGLRTQRLRLSATGIASLKVNTENEQVILGKADNNYVTNVLSRVRGGGGRRIKR